MRFTFDTEFIEDGVTIDLLSIGIVREDGAVYYAETDLAFVMKEGTYTRPDFDLTWLNENVVPGLIGTFEVCKQREVIAQEIINFAGDEPEFWAWYADYDWVVLCQLFGRMIDLPAGWPMYCRDYKQVVDTYNLPTSPQTTAAHNALNDARWLADELGFNPSAALNG